jgi:hypothetical protein
MAAGLPGHGAAAATAIPATADNTNATAPAEKTRCVTTPSSPNADWTFLLSFIQRGQE